MKAQSAPVSLFEVFSKMHDPRRRRGKVYPLASVLTLVSTAMLCGARSLYAIAQWGRDYNHLAVELGFTRKAVGNDGVEFFRTPCVAELHTLLARINSRIFEAALSSWILACGVADLQERIMHIDGKTLRGSQGHQLPGVQLLAAYCQEVGAAVAQLRVKASTNEHKTALQLLKLIPLQGTLVTGDAAFCQKDFCRQVVEGGGDYFVCVKENQKTLESDIRAAFEPSFSPS
jgi:hypothetical protein